MPAATRTCWAPAICPAGGGGCTAGGCVAGGGSLGLMVSRRGGALRQGIFWIAEGGGIIPKVGAWEVVGGVLLGFVEG